MLDPGIIEKIIITTGVALILSVLFVYRIIENRYGYHWAERFRIVQTFLLLILFLSHGIYTIGLDSIIGFIIMSVLISAIMEVLGVQFGLIFGPYHYNGNSCPLPSILGVPLCYPIAWCGIAYAAFWMGVLLMHGQVPDILVLSPALIILMAALVTLLDIVSDPIAVDEERWTWHRPGKFHGVPLSNFFGWFLTGLLIFTVFRFFRLALVLPVSSPFLVFLPAFGFIVYLAASARVCFERKLVMAGIIAVCSAVILSAFSIYYLVLA